MDSRLVSGSYLEQLVDAFLVDVVHRTLVVVYCMRSASHDESLSRKNPQAHLFVVHTQNYQFVDEQVESITNVGITSLNRRGIASAR